MTKTPGKWMWATFAAITLLHFAGSIRLWMWWDHHWIDAGTEHYCAGSLTLCYEFPCVWIPAVRNIEADGRCIHGYLAPSRAFEDIPWRGPLPFFWATNALFWGVAAPLAFRRMLAGRAQGTGGRGFEIVQRARGPGDEERGTGT